MLAIYRAATPTSLNSFATQDLLTFFSKILISYHFLVFFNPTLPPTSGLSASEKSSLSPAPRALLFHSVCWAFAGSHPVKTHVHQFWELLCDISLMLSSPFCLCSFWILWIESLIFYLLFLFFISLSFFLSVPLNFYFIFSFQEIFLVLYSFTSCA